MGLYQNSLPTKAGGILSHIKPAGFLFLEAQRADARFFRVARHPAYVRTKRATLSTWAVWGNMSKGSNEASRNPSRAISAASLARVGG